MMREERFEIDITSTPTQVWERLTTPEGLASWFGTKGEIDLRIGGVRTVGWGDEMEYPATITDLEPERRIRLVYLVDGEETGAEEWLIESSGGVVRLTLIQSMSDEGIDDWDGYFGDLRRGWQLFMTSMRHALTGARVPDRRVECRFIPAPWDAEETWDRLESVLTGSPLVDGLEPALLMPPHSRLLVADDRTLLLDVEGGGDDRVLYAQAATHDRDGAHDDGWRGRALDLATAALTDR